MSQFTRSRIRNMSTITISQAPSAKELKEKADELSRQKWACCKSNIDDSKLQEALELYVLAGEKYYDNSLYNESLECYHKAIPITRKLKNANLEATLNFQTAYILLCDLNNYDESFMYLQNSRLSFITTKVYQEYLLNMVFMGDKYFEKNNNHPYAENCYNFAFNDVIVSHFDEFKEKKDKEAIIHTFNSILTFYISRDNLPELLKKTIEFSKKYRKYDIYKKESVTLLGLIILLTFMVNNDNVSKDSLLRQYKEADNFIKEKKIYDEKIIDEVKQAIEYYCKGQKNQFFSQVKHLELYFPNLLMEKFRLMFSKKIKDKIKNPIDIEMEKENMSFSSSVVKESLPLDPIKEVKATCEVPTAEDVNVFDTQENLLVSEYRESQRLTQGPNIGRESHPDRTSNPGRESHQRSVSSPNRSRYYEYEDDNILPDEDHDVEHMSQYPEDEHLHDDDLMEDDNPVPQHEPQANHDHPNEQVEAHKPPTDDGDEPLDPQENRDLVHEDKLQYDNKKDTKPYNNYQDVSFGECKRNNIDTSRKELEKVNCSINEDKNEEAIFYSVDGSVESNKKDEDNKTSGGQPKPSSNKNPYVIRSNNKLPATEIGIVILNKDKDKDKNHEANISEEDFSIVNSYRGDNISYVKSSRPPMHMDEQPSEIAIKTDQSPEVDDNLKNFINDQDRIQLSDRNSPRNIIKIGLKKKNNNNKKVLVRTQVESDYYLNNFDFDNQKNIRNTHPGHPDHQKVLPRDIHPDVVSRDGLNKTFVEKDKKKEEDKINLFVEKITHKRNKSSIIQSFFDDSNKEINEINFNFTIKKSTPIPKDISIQKDPDTPKKYVRSKTVDKENSYANSFENSRISRISNASQIFSVTDCGSIYLDKRFAEDIV